MHSTNCHLFRLLLSFFVIAYAHEHISHNMPHTRKSEAKRQISPHVVRFCCVALDQLIARDITKLGIANLLCVTGGVFQWVSLQLFGCRLLQRSSCYP